MPPNGLEGLQVVANEARGNVFNLVSRISKTSDNVNGLATSLLDEAFHKTVLYDISYGNHLKVLLRTKYLVRLIVLIVIHEESLGTILLLTILPGIVDDKGVLLVTL